MQLGSRPNYVKAAFASVAASALLLMVPFVLPTQPLWPFLLLNWLLFMSVIYFAFFRPFRLSSFVQQPERQKLIAFNLTLVTFTIAGWVALFNAEHIV